MTPDSFSDGGRFLDPAAAIAHGLQLVADGAEILDIGGESTRPYADAVSEAEELRRALPVVQALHEQTEVPISIDTSKANVAREAVQAGAEIVNDVTGLQSDPNMVTTVAEMQVGVCVMHMQGTPRTMQANPVYDDVVSEVHDYLRQRRDDLVDNGIAVERICLDPGIGFGKTLSHNLALLQQCEMFHALDCPVLVGHSRKRFIGDVLEDMEASRTAGTIGVALALAHSGVQVLRVHDVLAVNQALTLYEASGGLASTWDSRIAQ